MTEEQRRENQLSTAKSLSQSEAVPPRHYKVPVWLISPTFMTLTKVVGTGR